MTYSTGSEVIFRERISQSNTIVPELHDAVMKKAKKSRITRALGKLIGRGGTVDISEERFEGRGELRTERYWTTPLLDQRKGADGLSTGWKVRVAYSQDGFKQGDDVQVWSEKGLESFRYIDLLRVVEKDGQEMGSELAFRLGQYPDGHAEVLARLEGEPMQYGYIFPGIMGVSDENLWSTAIVTSSHLLEQVRSL